MFKSALAGALITNQQFAINQWRSWRDKIIDHNLHWRILRINFDTLTLYAKAIQISDLLAYQNAVEQACQQIKHLIEEEYPLGNEIYRDSTGIYFTFPDLDLPAELEQEIRRRIENVEHELAPFIALTIGDDGATAQDQLKSILGKARTQALQALSQPFSPHNLNPIWQQKWDEAQRDPGKWEACPVCRLRPKEEHQEICTHCEQRRAPRLETWRANPTRTIWLGEIADHNDRVCLLVGKFGLDAWLSGDLIQTMLVTANPATNTFTPKNSSPARLRRVWETCQKFWHTTVQGDILFSTLANHRVRKHIIPNRAGWQHGLYNGKINDKPLDLFWDGQAFLTISNLQAAGELKPSDTIILEHPETKRKDKIQIQAMRESPEPYARYQAFLPLHASPDQFLAFIPAADALEIVRKIRDEYEKQFGKVRNRLPLYLGLIYFDRRMPLMAVMDAARQMLDCPSHAENWQVEAKKDDDPPHQGWPRAVQLTLTQAGKSIPVEVSTVMGDGSTEDIWYPYFELDGAPAAYHTRQFQHNHKTWVHVNNLQQGDVVHITPSTFRFLYLDTAARRFEIHPNNPHPYYIEDLFRLDQVWQTFSQLTRTQLKQTLYTIETARARWFGRDEQRDSTGDKTFKQFVADTLANAQWDWKNIPENAKNQLITAAVRGELTDLAQLHLEILKEKLQGETA